MTHLDDGTLQAFLDHELPAGGRSEAAEHLLGCEACHAAYEELMRANALFSRSVAVLDADAPALDRTAPARRRTRRRAGAFTKAAGLVLVVAAAASAAVPGSPVRAWIVQTVQPELGTTPPVDAPAPAAPEAVAVPAAPVGVSIGAARGELVVSLQGLEGATIRLERVAGERARVEVVGADRDPAFRTRAGRLEVRDGAGGTVTVRLPAGVAGARLEVDGRMYAINAAGALDIRVPAERADSLYVWP